MTTGLQYQKYLDWLEDRGQVHPRFAVTDESRDKKRFKAILVHGIPDSIGLHDAQSQLLSRIATACGFDPDQTTIQSASTLEGGITSLDFTGTELVLTFGDMASQAWERLAGTIDLDSDIVIYGPTIETLEASPAEKRDLWKKLQAHKAPQKTVT